MNRWIKTKDMVYVGGPINRMYECPVCSARVVGQPDKCPNCESRVFPENEADHEEADHEVTEWCPHCEHEVTVQWNIDDDGMQIYCPYCGKPIMLCSYCDVRDGGKCNWKEISGCKYSDDRYTEYYAAEKEKEA